MAELSNRFASIAKVCNMDEEGDVFFTPKKEYVLARSYLIPPGLTLSLGRSIKTL